MKNIPIYEREFRLFDDNREVAENWINLFVQALEKVRDPKDLQEHLTDMSTRIEVLGMLSFYEQGFFNSQGEITLKGVDLGHNLSSEEFNKMLNGTKCFDKASLVNGWIVDEKGVVYPAKNHAKLLQFLTLMGKDCSSYIRVTNKSIGLAMLNFSSVETYVYPNKPFTITKEQVMALYNIKSINEKRFDFPKLDFEDYLLDSMLAGFIMSGTEVNRNMKTIQDSAPEDVDGRRLVELVRLYQRDRERYVEDYGVNLNL